MRRRRTLLGVLVAAFALTTFGAPAQAVNGTIIVRKVTIPADVDLDFDASVTGDGVDESGPINDGANTELNTGLIPAFDLLTGQVPVDYTVSETQNPGWRLVGANCECFDVLQCLPDQDPTTGPVNILVASTVICTFTNERIPPEVPAVGPWGLGAMVTLLGLGLGAARRLRRARPA